MALTAAELNALFTVDDTQATQTLEEFPDKVSGMATAVAASAVVVGAAFAAGVAGAMNVEDARAKLTAQLGLTAEESARYGDLAGRVYAGNYGESLEEVNGAIGAVLSSVKGMRTASDAEVEAMTTKALNLASAFEIDVSRAVQVAGQMITTGMAPDAETAMDLLSAAMQRVPAAVREDILDAVDEYGPFMTSLGIQGEQAFGLLVASAEQGMYGIDKTGDALKEFTIRATDMSSASKAGYDLLGLSQEDMTKKILAGGDSAAGAFQDIIDGLLSMKDPAAQSQAALALFGTPLEDLGVNEIPKFLESMQLGGDAMAGFAGSADQIDSALGGTASAALESFKRQAQATFVDFVGGQALPVVTSFATYLRDNLGPAVTAVTGFYREHSEVINPILVAVGTMIGLVVAWTVAMRAYAAVQALVNVVMAANPIGIIIVLIAGLVAGLIYAYNESETFRNIVDTAFRAVGQAANWIGDQFQKLWVIAQLVWRAVADWVRNKVAEIVGVAASILAFRDRVIGHFESLRAQAIAKAAALVSWVRGMPGMILNAVGDLGSTLAQKGRDLIQGMWDGIRGMGSWLANKVSGFVKDFIPGPIADALGISSPSKVAKDLLRWVPVGMADGLLSGAGVVAGAAATLADAALPGGGAMGITAAASGAMTNGSGGSGGGTLRLSDTDIWRLADAVGNVRLELDGEKVTQHVEDDMGYALRGIR